MVLAGGVSRSRMNLFRSEDMRYLAITMTNEAAHSTVRELGKLAKLHVIDVSTHTHSHTASRALCNHAIRLHPPSEQDRLPAH